MLKEQAGLFRKLSIICDAALAVGCFVAAHAYLVAGMPSDLVVFLEDHVVILTVILTTNYVAIERSSLYVSIRKYSFYDLSVKVLSSALIGVIVVSSVTFVIDWVQAEKELLLLFYGIFALSLLLEKVLVKAILGFFRRRGFNTRNLLFVGTSDKARSFSQVVDQHRDWGLNIVGFLQVNGDTHAFSEGNGRVLGHVRELLEICKQHPIDEVIFCLPKNHVIDAEEHLRELEELGITVRMVLDFYDLHQARRELSFFHDVPLLTFHTKSLDATQLLFKRLLDVVGSLVGLGLLALIFPFVALAIKLNDPGPVFFGQDRVGENGRIFKCWKFRSMYVDAEARKQELMAQNEMKGAMFKIKDDPRITPVGKFLRKTSLDEFPQFWNVFLGEMSLVGTRPPTPAEVEQYQNWHRRRITIKPGITGLWQVSGRNQISDFDEVVRLDLHYIDNWSFWLDLKILLKTIKVVFLREGSS